jgi:hypothetical protein
VTQDVYLFSSPCKLGTTIVRIGKEASKSGDGRRRIGVDEETGACSDWPGGQICLTCPYCISAVAPADPPREACSVAESTLMRLDRMRA